MTKESVYGWYPSVRNVYENSQAVKGHEREALFRYYKQQQNRDPPDTPEPWRSPTPAGTPTSLNGGFTITKAPLSPRASVRGSSGRAAYRTKSAPARKVASRALGKPPSAVGTRVISANAKERPSTSKSEDSKRVHVGTIRPASAVPSDRSGLGRSALSPYTQAREAYAQRFSIPTPDGASPAPLMGYEIPFAPPMRNIPTPNLSQYEYRVDTPKPTIEFHIDTPSPILRPEVVMPQASYLPESTPQTPEPEMIEEYVTAAPRPPTSPPASATKPGSRASRVQSATVRRERSAVPPRPVKSACGQRTPNSEVYSEVKLSSAPPSKASSTPCINITPCHGVDPSSIDPRSYNKQYEEIVKQYGWRAQVHGNPLKLKKVIPRLAYTKKCAEPEMRPEPPRFHWQNFDTYFQNTIPHKPMSFTIHPNFVSETLNAKRMELQRREGVNYRYKDYAFSY